MEASSDILNLAPILIAFVVIVALLGALKGFTRGISRQLIRTITVVASIFIAFFAATGCYTALISFLEGKTMADVSEWIANTFRIGSETDISWLNNIDIETLKLVLTLPMALIIMPVIFVVAFITVSGFMLIVHAILSALFGFSKKRNNIMTRLLGMGLGLVQGLVVAGILLTPIVGIGTTVEEAVTVLNEQAPNEDSTDSINKTYDKYVKSVSDNILFKAYSNLGINAIYKSIATVDIDGSDFDTTTLIPDIAIITGEITDLKGCDYKNLTPEHENSINSIIDTVDNNVYLKRVFAGTIKTFAYFYEAKDGAILQLGEPIDSIINTAMTIFQTTDETTVISDLTTIKDVYFTLSRDGVLNSFDSGSDALLNALTKRDEAGVTTVNKVTTTINKNERTKPLTKLITQISISVMSKQNGMDESTAATYDSVVADINQNAIKIDKNSYPTEEEYVAAVSASLDETFKRNNMNVEKNIVDDMAKHIADNYSDKDEITDEEANDIILSYYDAYLKNNESQ